jgi:hypothetical protein
MRGLGDPAILTAWLFGMDQGGFGLHPFVQMLQNPHFSVPHGLVLFALAFLVTGENTGRTSAYAAAGVMAALAGLSRPYELLAFALVVPALHLVSPSILDARRLAQRALVLVLVLPAWAQESFARGCEEVYRLRGVRILRCTDGGPHLE